MQTSFQVGGCEPREGGERVNAFRQKHGRSRVAVSAAARIGVESSVGPGKGAANTAGLLGLRVNP